MRIAIATKNSSRWGPVAWVLLRTELGQAGLNDAVLMMKAMEGVSPIAEDAIQAISGHHLNVTARSTEASLSNFDLVLAIGVLSEFQGLPLSIERRFIVVSPQDLTHARDAAELDDLVPVTTGRVELLQSGIKRLVGLISEHGTNVRRINAALIGSAAATGSESSPKSSQLPELNGVELSVEEDLRACLIANWGHTHFATKWTLIEGASGGVAVELPAGPTGRMDLLARSRTNNDLLVIELKRGVASDDAVAQCLRYMGWLSGDGKTGEGRVFGMIIASGFDEHARCAAKVVPSLSLCSYTARTRVWLTQVNEG